MLNRLKEEVFFLKRLAQEGFGPADFWRYFKNRFFGNFLLSLLQPVYHQSQDNFELHLLFQKKDLWMLVWALNSFLYHSGLYPKIIVHDDGSISDRAAKLLESKFSNLKVLAKVKADKMVTELIPGNKNILEYRQAGHKLILKLIDIFLLNSGKVMVLDSDVLFFKKPDEIIDFVKNRSKFEALVSMQNSSYDLMVKDEYFRGHRLLEKKAGFINSGIMLFKREKLSLDQLEEFLENTRRPKNDYWVEMSGWASMLSQLNFAFLPLERYVIKGRPNDQTVAKHFTNPRRYELYAYGIDAVRKMIGAGK